MSQDYTSVPKTIVRNINYFILFKVNDNISLNNIIRNHNIADVDSSIIKADCNLCTKTFGNSKFVVFISIIKKFPKKIEFLLLLVLQNQTNQKIFKLEDYYDRIQPNGCH